MIRIPVVASSHEQVGAVVRPGDFAIDATAGNGGDTEFLCRAVGPAGRVLAVDVQRTAIETVRKRLARRSLLDRCILIEADHARISSLAERYVPGKRPAAVMFNLGYLPGGDKSITTDSETSVQGLRGASAILKSGGIISIVIYRGHSGAIEEAEAVEGWLSGLDPNKFEVSRLGRDGVPAHRPYAAFVRSRSGASGRPH